MRKPRTKSNESIPSEIPIPTHPIKNEPMDVSNKVQQKPDKSENWFLYKEFHIDNHTLKLQNTSKITIVQFDRVLNQITALLNIFSRKNSNTTASLHSEESEYENESFGCFSDIL
jgi:predicted ATPase